MADLDDMSLVKCFQYKDVVLVHLQWVFEIDLQVFLVAGVDQEQTWFYEQAQPELVVDVVLAVFLCPENSYQNGEDEDRYTGEEPSCHCVEVGYTRNVWNLGRGEVLYDGDQGREKHLDVDPDVEIPN